MDQMPVLFIGHGSPMNVVADNRYTQSLQALGQNLPKPSSILVISAHWLTQGTRVTGSAQPKMIYDFYGFPAELYQVRYDCTGAPQQAERIARIVGGARSDACDPGRGIDHAGWAVLKHMYPAADIPVMEMSLDMSLTTQEHYAFARQLQHLRNEGVLILASGNVIHNLQLAQFDAMDAEPYPWVLETNAQLKQLLADGDHNTLVDCEKIVHFQRANPTIEHYLPLIYALALQGRGERLRFICDDIQNASVSMLSLVIG